ncbi:MAG: hypothetical protein ABJA02_16285 [Acidobacteriota bacterium]
MNIRDAVTAEHSITTTNAIVEYIGTDAARFQELVDLFLGDDRRLAQRAGWPLSYVVQLHTELAAPHLERFVDQLERKDVHDAVIRNAARLLQYVEIPPELEGRVLDICFRMVEDQSVPVATRVYCMTTAARIAEDEPELLRELRLMVAKHAENAKPAFLNRAKHLLAEK